MVAIAVTPVFKVM